MIRSSVSTGYGAPVAGMKTLDTLGKNSLDARRVPCAYSPFSWPPGDYGGDVGSDLRPGAVTLTVSGHGDEQVGAEFLGRELVLDE